jgi:riboflavin biosynthesis pyrimidine reductase
MEDLVDWREAAGLPPIPDVVIVSSSLEFDPEVAFRLSPRVTVVTDETGPSERITALWSAGMDVVLAGEERVEGVRLADVLFESGFQLVYVAAGPRVLHLVVDAGVLDRLFITSVSQLLGGSRFSTLTEGEAFHPPVELQLDALFLDSESHPQVSQLFAIYAASVPS